MADSDDVFKSAGKFLDVLKQATKQVTGIGRGTVKVELDRVRASAGGKLRGRVVLALTEPVEAKRLIVSLRARQKVLTKSKTPQGRSVQASHVDVYKFDEELAGKGTFAGGTYPFTLTVPPDALKLGAASAGAHPLLDVVRLAASALAPGTGPVEWQVIGKLEIAWGRDLSSTVDIVVAA